MESILAFDCTDEACSAALLCDGKLQEIHLDEPRQHSKQLLRIISDLLEARSLKLDELNAIAFGAGPGSFTGVRIAHSVAQALSFAHDIPLLPISSLQALAQTVASQSATSKRILSRMDARMDELYVATFESHDGKLERVTADRLISVLQWGAYLSALPHPVQHLIQTRPMRLEWDDTIVSQVAQIHAKELLVIAQEELRQGKGQSAFDVQPIYLRGHSAWKKLSVSSTNLPE